MPWTDRQFRFLMSSGSPLTNAQKDKDKAEAHSDPSLIHRKPGGDSIYKRAAQRAARR
jgi:hypothetical protein